MEQKMQKNKFLETNDEFFDHWRRFFYGRNTLSLISSHKNRLCLLERGIVHLKFQIFCDSDELDLLEKGFFL